jgi:hypothetical protein
VAAHRLGHLSDLESIGILWDYDVRDTVRGLADHVYVFGEVRVRDVVFLSVRGPLGADVSRPALDIPSRAGVRLGECERDRFAVGDLRKEARLLVVGAGRPDYVGLEVVDVKDDPDSTGDLGPSLLELPVLAVIEPEPAVFFGNASPQEPDLLEFRPEVFARESVRVPLLGVGCQFLPDVFVRCFSVRLEGVGRFQP